MHCYAETGRSRPFSPDFTDNFIPLGNNIQFALSYFNSSSPLV